MLVDVEIGLRALVLRHASKTWRLVIILGPQHKATIEARKVPPLHETPTALQLCSSTLLLLFKSQNSPGFLTSFELIMPNSQLQNVLSGEKSTSGFKVALHPLVILTISDYLTRHTLRNQPGPLIGALLGQQNESHVSIEHAFEVNALTGQVDVPWFKSRLEDSK